MDKKFKLLTIFFILTILLGYTTVYTTYAYAGHMGGIDSFAKTYCYARRTIVFEATKIGGSSIETIQIDSRTPLTKGLSTSAAEGQDSAFIEYGNNENKQTIIYSGYNQIFRPSNLQAYTIDSSNASTYVVNPYGNGTTSYYNVSNSLSPFTNVLTGMGESYTAVLSSPRIMMNTWCAANGYLSPVLINQTVSVDSKYQRDNLISGKHIDFVTIGQSEPMNLSSSIGTIQPQGAGAIAAAIILVFLAVYLTIELVSQLQGSSFTAALVGWIAGGQSSFHFPENQTYQFELDPMIQDILNDSYQQYLLGNISYDEFMGIWSQATNASVPDTLNIGYAYTDTSGEQDIFTTITAFVRNLIPFLLMVGMIIIGVIIFSYIVRFMRPARID